MVMAWNVLGEISLLVRRIQAPDHDSLLLAFNEQG
jgi:hypothetical protein